MPERRFPPPWSVGETNACFIVCDANRQALAYVYFEDQQGRRTAQRSTARSRAHTPLRRFILICGALCPSSPRSVIVSPCSKQPASTARTAQQSTSLFAPRRDRHQTTRLNVAGVARRFGAAKASSFLSIFSLVADGPKPRRRAAGECRAGLKSTKRERRETDASMSSACLAAGIYAGVGAHDRAGAGRANHGGQSDEDDLSGCGSCSLGSSGERTGLPVRPAMAFHGP